MFQLSEEIILLIKWVAIIQLVLIFFFVLLSYITSAYSKHRKRQTALKIKHTEEKWIRSFQENQLTAAPEILNPEHLSLNPLLEIIKKIDQQFNKNVAWGKKREEIMQNWILPEARKLSDSTDWFDRFTACQAFELAIQQNPVDEPIVKKLLYDEIPIVALDAEKIAIRFNSQTLVDAIADCFSKTRHVQQSFYAELLPEDSKTLAPLFANTLSRSDSPYVKAFCYRALSVFLESFETIPSLEQDIHSENLELKLAALNYLAHTDSKKAEIELKAALKNPVWEVRAKAANLLGRLQIVSSAHLLETTLRDSEWWVRINSAEALLKLGEPGIKILKDQTPEKDRFAYETAQSVLLRMQVKK